MNRRILFLKKEERRRRRRRKRSVRSTPCGPTIIKIKKTPGNDY